MGKIVGVYLFCQTGLGLRRRKCQMDNYNEDQAYRGGSAGALTPDARKQSVSGTSWWNMTDTFRK